MMGRRCSIIVLNYNTYALTCNCIASIYQHVLNVEVEIIVVDNASTERDPAGFVEQFPGVNLVKSSVNVGFAKGNNLGIQHATAPFVLLLNSDIELLSDITPAIELLEQDSSIGVVTGRLEFPDGSPQPVAGVFPTLSRELRELFRITRLYTKQSRGKYYLGDTWNYDKPVEADWVWGAFFLFRRKDLDAFPGQKLHEDFFMYGEDLQWCHYFKMKLGKRVAYTPTVRAIHFMGRSDSSGEPAEQKYFSKLLPNEYRWMKSAKGSWYAHLYYLVKSLYYLTLRREQDLSKAKKFFRYAIGNQ